MPKFTRNENYIPPILGKTFLLDLSTLVDDLVRTGGFREQYLKDELLSKYCDTTTTLPSMRRQAAIQKWLLAEDTNRTTNERIPFGEDFGWCHSDDIRAKARDIIKRVLGDISEVDYLSSGSHTNGASPRVRRSELAAILKHSGKAQGTEAALLQWRLGIESQMLRAQEVEAVLGSELFTVPKKSDIDRVACKEPEINLFLQRAVGHHIKSRLRKKPFFIDLYDQTRNQELARMALVEGLATVDLKSASDTISRALVYDLLPFEWWSYLDDIRSHYVTVDGKVVELEMFSSMGNGFTFELESLIFYALTRAVCWLSGVKGTISVFGDDIIAPSRIVPRLVKIFHWYGFTTNQEKTHYRGPFRESCGKHYHSSRDVTPFYIRGPIETKTDMIRVLNRLLIWDAFPYQWFCDPRVAKFHRKWSAHIPRELWGGQDPDDISSLVTGHSPRKRLIPKAKDLRKVGLKLMGLDYDRYRFLRWFTVAEGIPDSSPEIVPSKMVEHVTVDQPDWIARTSWMPYYLWGEPDADYPR